MCETTTTIKAERLTAVVLRTLEPGCDRCEVELSEANGWSIDSGQEFWCTECLRLHHACPDCEEYTHADDWDAAEECCDACSQARREERLEEVRDRIRDMLDECEDEDRLDDIRALLAR